MSEIEKRPQTPDQTQKHNYRKIAGCIGRIGLLASLGSPAVYVASNVFGPVQDQRPVVSQSVEPSERSIPAEYVRRKFAGKETEERRAIRIEDGYVSGRHRGSNDFSTATSPTQPFFKRDEALGRMDRDSAAFWSRDVTLPFWVREKYNKK